MQVQQEKNQAAKIKLKLDIGWSKRLQEQRKNRQRQNNNSDIRTLIMYFKVSVELALVRQKRKRRKIRKEKQSKSKGQDVPGLIEAKALSKIQEESRPKITFATAEDWLIEVIYQISIKDNSQYNKKMWKKTKKDLLAKWIYGMKAQWNLNINSSHNAVTPRPRDVKNWKKKKKDTLLGILEKIFVECSKNQKMFNEIQERFLERKPSFRKGKKNKKTKKRREEESHSRNIEKSKLGQTNQDLKPKK